MSTLSTSLSACVFKQRAQVIRDAGVRMRQSGAFIWSVSLSQIPHHLQCEGISTRWNPCVGFCFGVLNRPSLTELNTRYGAVGEDRQGFFSLY